MSDSTSKELQVIPHCPVCSSDVRDAVMCANCQAPHCKKCWTYNGKCGRFACDSKVEGKSLAPQEFVDVHLQPVYNSLNTLLQGTPNADVLKAYKSLYDTAKFGAMSPSIIHNRLDAELGKWQAHYKTRLEERCSQHADFEDVAGDPTSLASKLNDLSWIFKPRKSHSIAGFFLPFLDDLRPSLMPDHAPARWNQLHEFVTDTMDALDIKKEAFYLREDLNEYYDRDLTKQVTSGSLAAMSVGLLAAPGMHVAVAAGVSMIARLIWYKYQNAHYTSLTYNDMHPLMDAPFTYQTIYERCMHHLTEQIQPKLDVVYAVHKGNPVDQISSSPSKTLLIENSSRSRSGEFP